MEQTNVVSLIKDLSAKLTAVADEFSGRVHQVTAGSAEPVEAPPLPASPSPTDATIATARRLINERRLRRRHLPEELFHEPAWDMLLSLYLAHHEDRVVNVKTLVSAADAPVTTSQRWIDHMGKLGLIHRVVDPVDRRRIEVSLSPDGMRAIEGYLAAVG